VVAQALYQLALTYEKRRDPRAELMLARLANDYATASPFASEAKKKLAALQKGAGKSPFASRTLDPDLGLGSPDGKLVVSWKNGVLSRLYVRDLGSGAERVLVDLDGTVSNWAWSPDGRELAFHFQNDARKLADIRIVTVATGATRSLAVFAFPTAWTTSGDPLLRAELCRQHGRLVIVPTASDEPRKILAAPISDLVREHHAGQRLLSPTGTKLVLIDVTTGAEQPSRQARPAKRRHRSADGVLSLSSRARTGAGRCTSHRSIDCRCGRRCGLPTFRSPRGAPAIAPGGPLTDC
jgi:dipeptidyl aminopeptidase/acylaminoacyl peptidase